MLDNIWRIPCLQPADRVERIGYPTQKPIELMQRIIEAASDPGDLVADLFGGGGAFIAAAAGLRAKRDVLGHKSLVLEGQPRRWIGCDISRVAVSVTLDRIVKICEEQSGVKSNYSKVGAAVQSKLELPETKSKVPDARVVFVGVYPMDRFKAVDGKNFEQFILHCQDASLNTTGEAITGFRNQLEPMLVGPADPDEVLDAKRVKAFFEECLKHLQPNTRQKAKVFAWKFSPALIEYRKTLLGWIAKHLPEKNVAMEFDYVPINSQEFRERIIRKYPDATDNEFFLRFTNPPIIGDIKVTQFGGRKYRFEAVDTYSGNLDGYLVNCQWDFAYQRGHFAADAKYVLGRQENKGKAGHKFEAVLIAEHVFEAPCTRTVACRVQDNLGGESIKAVSVEVK